MKQESGKDSLLIPHSFWELLYIICWINDLTYCTQLWSPQLKMPPTRLSNHTIYNRLKSFTNIVFFPQYLRTIWNLNILRKLWGVHFHGIPANEAAKWKQYRWNLANCWQGWQLHPALCCHNQAWALSHIMLNIQASI